MTDLISRETAKKAIHDKIVSASTVVRMWNILDSVPAVDAASVVHGRWTEKETSENTIDEWQSAKCTNCGKYHTTPYLYYFSDYNFCPNCGAKMDGDA